MKTHNPPHPGEVLSALCLKPLGNDAFADTLLELEEWFGAVFIRQPDNRGERRIGYTWDHVEKELGECFLSCH